MNATIQYSTTPITANEMNADDINILSAKGSRKRPSGVTWLYFLAKYPSYASVIEATIKMTKALTRE